MEKSVSRIDPEKADRVTSNGDALGELRRLIVGPEQEKLGKIQERLDNPAIHAEDISRVLPDAIILRTRQNGDLATALSSTIGDAIRSSVKKHPQPLVDALFPVIGPAIRKSISDSLQRMIQSLNQTIEYSLSIKSLKWRLEARRTNKPFAEIVLLHTLVYRVEQVFLIHRDTGLLLHQVSADSAARQDGDMVSGMLTAVRDFVRDSFGGAETETLDDLHIGERTIWIVKGPHAVVAAVIFGFPPRELKEKMEEVCEQIHREQGSLLAAFNGDTAPFELTHSRLEGCLAQALRDPVEKPVKVEKPKRSRAPWVIGSVLIAALLLV